MEQIFAGGDSATRHTRVAWIDAARLLCIIFVLLLHSPLRPTGDNSLLAGGAVCAFFFLAGFFNKKQGRELLQRCITLFIFCQVWDLAYLHIVALHHSLKGIPYDLWNHYLLRHLSAARCSGMWFIEYLVLWMLLSPLFFRLKRLPIQLLCIVGLLGVYAYNYIYITEDPHSHISYPLSAAMFYLGCATQRIKVKELGEHLFLNSRFVPPTICCLLSFFLITATIWGVYARMPFLAAGVNGWWLLPMAYLILTISYYTEKVLPSLASFLATSGPAIIFIFGIHNCIFCFYAASWSYMMGHSENPPAILTLLLLALLIIACTCICRKLKGKFRLLDLFLFGC